MKSPFLKRLSRQLRGRWRSKVLAQHGIGVVAQTKNGLLALQPGDFNVSRALLEHGEYDWSQVRWLGALLDPESHLIFAGSHIGSVLVPLVRLSGASRVLAFEPSPQNFRLLEMNLKLNELRRVVAKNLALGERPGTIRFTENPINTGNSRVSAAHGEIEVTLATLDQAVPAEWPVIELIVMDIEGSEVSAMRGAATVLSKTRNLYVEFAPEQLQEQNSSAAEFVALAEQYFQSAYIFGSPIRFFGPGEFGAHLLSLQRQRGLLLNVLLTQDVQPVDARMQLPRAVA